MDTNQILRVELLADGLALRAWRLELVVADQRGKLVWSASATFVRTCRGLAISERVATAARDGWKWIRGGDLDKLSQVLPVIGLAASASDHRVT